MWALRYQPWVTVDGTEYIRIADALAQRHPFPSIFPPGYPALIALARALVLDRTTAAAVVSLVCGSLLPWPTWRLARQVVGPRWALLPALAVALHPTLVLFSTITMSESAYALALFGSLALAASGRALPAGLAIGAAYATRPEALVPATALAVRGWFSPSASALDLEPAPGRGGTNVGARLRAPALGALGFLMLAVPCWLYFHSTLGAWTLTPKAAAAVRAQGRNWREEEPRLTPPVASRPLGLGERLGRFGPTLVQSYPRNAVAYLKWLLHLWPAPLLLLSLVGWTRRRGVESVALLHLLIIPFVAVSVQSRFLLPVLPALAILAAVPLASFPHRAARIALAVAWLAGATWCGRNLGRDLVLPFDGYVAAEREAGEWLSGVAEPDAAVMDRKPYTAFYANRGYRVMPDEPYETLIDAAVREGIRYLALDEGVIRVFRPQLMPLLQDSQFRDHEQRLEMIYLGGHVKGWGIAIFRVLRPGEIKTGRPPYFNVRWMARPGARR